MRTSLHLLAALALAAASLAGLVGLAGLTGCDSSPCIRHSDCDPGLVCSAAGACLVPVDGDAGVDAAPDAAIDAAVDAASDAPPPPRPETESSSGALPTIPEAGLPHDLTNVNGSAP